MNPVLVDLGFIKIYWYSIMILLGVLLGGYVIIKEAKKFNINEDIIINFLFYLIPITIIGARLYYVIFNLDYYSTNILSVFKIWEGGLAIHGGILFGLIWLLIYSKRYNIKSLRLLDIVCVGLIIGQAIGRWGNFFNQEAYGSIVNLSFLKNLHLPNFIIKGMYIGGYYYHPTFLYESLWCLVGFIILLVFRRINNIKIGQILALYLIWYGLGRFFIESLRTDSLMLGNIKIAQLISIIMILIGIILFVIRLKNKDKTNNYMYGFDNK